MGLLDQLNEVLVQTPRKYWGDKATRLGSLLSDSAATGAQAYGSANSPMAPEHANTLAGLLADFTPGLGDVKSAYDGLQSAREGDYLGAALGGLGALPLVPSLGGVIKKVGSKEMEQLLKYGQEADDYLYHIAPLSSVKRIMSEGLQPKPLGRSSTFESPIYRKHGIGKAFLTERDGVPYWMERIENSLFHSYDKPPPVRIVKIPKKDIKSPLIADDIGTADANHPAWYVTETIPPK